MMAGGMGGGGMMGAGAGGRGGADQEHTPASQKQYLMNEAGDDNVFAAGIDDVAPSVIGNATEDDVPDAFGEF